MMFALLPSVMNKELLNWRYYFLLVLGGVSITLIVSVPVDGNLLKWLSGLIITKGVGFICALLTYKYLVKWDVEGKIPFLSLILEEEDC